MGDIIALNRELETLERNLEALQQRRFEDEQESIRLEAEIEKVTFLRDRQEIDNFIAKAYANFAFDDEMQYRIAAMEDFVKETFSMGEDGKLPKKDPYLDYYFDEMPIEDQELYLKAFPAHLIDEEDMDYELGKISFRAALYEEVVFGDRDSHTMQKIINQSMDSRYTASVLGEDIANTLYTVSALKGIGTEVLLVGADFFYDYINGNWDALPPVTEEAVKSFVKDLHTASDEDDLKALQNQYDAMRSRLQDSEENVYTASEAGYVKQADDISAKHAYNNSLSENLAKNIDVIPLTNAVYTILTTYNRFQNSEHDMGVDLDAPFKVASTLLHNICMTRGQENLDKEAVNELRAAVSRFYKAKESYWYPAKNGKPCVMEEIIAEADKKIAKGFQKEPISRGELSLLTYCVQTALVKQR